MFQRESFFPEVTQGPRTNLSDQPKELVFVSPVVIAHSSTSIGQVIG